MNYAHLFVLQNISHEECDSEYETKFLVTVFHV